MMILIVNCVFFQFCFQCAHGSGFFELQVLEMANPRAELSSGDCCGGAARAPSATRCPSPCNTFFRLCLKEYQSNVTSTGSCSFGNSSSPVLGRDSFTLADPERGKLVLPFTFRWTVSTIPDPQIKIGAEARNFSTPAADVPEEGARDPRKQLVGKCVRNKCLHSLDLLMCNVLCCSCIELLGMPNEACVAPLFPTVTDDVFMMSFHSTERSLSPLFCDSRNPYCMSSPCLLHLHQRHTCYYILMTFCGGVLAQCQVNVVSRRFSFVWFLRRRLLGRFFFFAVELLLDDFRSVVERKKGLSEVVLLLCEMIW